MYNTVLDLIGNTPLVKLSKMVNPTMSQVWVKLEGYNPGGSVKDRPALYMIEDAERKGLLSHGKIILEASSGNTGIGLALIGVIKGYEVHIVMPENASIERKKILKALGAKVILTPKEERTDGAIKRVCELKDENNDYVVLDQFNNPANILAHYETTGREIWEQTEGKVTMFVAGMGTGGTLMGVGKRLKQYNPDIKIVGVEPLSNHKIQGLKCMSESATPAIFERRNIDETIIVKDEDAFRTARELASREGLILGMSSGASIFSALKKARQCRNEFIVALSADNGERYLSTALYGGKRRII